jgi:WD repeat-containing protein 22
MVCNVLFETSSLTRKLVGHKSIVNTTLIHPSFLHILTSGVERHIILHATTESSPCALNLARTDTDVRNLPGGTPEDRERFIRALHGSRPVFEESDESGDEFDTIPLFDQ